MVMEMNNQERIAHLKARDYQKYLGVKKYTFDMMLQILEKDYQRKHKMGGRPPIAIHEISKEYQRQKTNQRSPKSGSARKPQQYLAEAGVIT